MDIRKVALYLSGKTPPEYKKSNRLEFMEYLEEIFGYKYDKLDFYRKQAKEYEEEFYFMILDLLNIKAGKDENEKTKFENLIEKLELPNEVIGKIYIDYDSLKIEWGKLKTEKNPQTKGKMLEDFLEKLFNKVIGFETIHKNLNLEEEEFDLVIKNKSNNPFIMSIQSPIILLEAKNRSKKIEASKISEFKGKLSNHISWVNMGIFVSVGGFTNGTDISQARNNAQGLKIVLITGDDIDELLDNKLNINEWFETRITNSLK